MKRTGRKSLIASIIALSLVLTGIGYAYWTDTLNVTTRATTGDMEITFVDLGLYAQYGDERVKGSWSIVDGIGDGFVADDFFLRDNTNYNIIAKDGTIEAYYDRADGYNRIEFDAALVGDSTLQKDFGDYKIGTKNSDTIEVSVFNMYPGYAQAFRSDIINTGSIAAKLSNVAFDVSNLNESELTDETKDMLGVALLVVVDNNPQKVFKLCTAVADGDNYFALGGVDFLRVSALEDLSELDIRNALENSEIKCYADAHHRMDLYLGIAMDPDAEGVFTSGSTLIEGYQDNSDKDALSQNDGVTISIDFAWDQFNAGVNEGVGNYLKNQNK